MNRITRFASTLAGIAVAAVAHAAPPTPAHWTAAGPKGVAPGATFNVTLTAHIDPGWHLYALDEPDGGPLPTVIGLAQGDPLALLDVNEPEPRKVPDPVTHTVSGMFQDTATFTLKVRAPRSRPAAGTGSHILVRYQTCNDQVCLPPHTETVPLPLEGLVR